MNNREKLLNTLEDYEKKIENTKRALKKLEDKKEALYSRAVLDEMKSRKLTLSDFYKRMDNVNGRSTESKQPVSAENKQLSSEMSKFVHFEDK